MNLVARSTRSWAKRMNKKQQRRWNRTAVHARRYRVVGARLSPACGSTLGQRSSFAHVIIVHKLAIVIMWCWS